MTNIRYIPITQQPYCCFPACLQMVMLRYQIPLVDQETLAVMMGLIIPEKDKLLFAKARTAKEPPFGVIVKNESMMPQVVFERLGVPLSLELHLESEFEDTNTTRQYIIEQLKANALVVNLDTRALNGTKDSYGHSLIIESYNLTDDAVCLIDPSPDQAKRRVISIDGLTAAVKQYGARNWGGFWQISKT